MPKKLTPAEKSSKLYQKESKALLANEKLNYQSFSKKPVSSSVASDSSYYQQQKEFQDSTPKYYNDFEQYIRPPEPELITPDLKKVISSAQVEKLDREKVNLTKKINDTNQKIRKNKQEEANIVLFYNSGSVKKDTYEKKLAQVTKQFQELETLNRSLEEKITKIDSMVQTRERDINENERLIKETNQKNKDLIKGYKEELQLINQVHFPDYNENESDLSFFNRLKQEAHKKVSDAEVNKLKFYSIKKFNEKMREVVRDLSVIEQVSNALGYEDRLAILKKFPLFKKMFTEVFGSMDTLSPFVTAKDILEVCHYFIMKNSSTPEIHTLYPQENPFNQTAQEENPLYETAQYYSLDNAETHRQIVKEISKKYEGLRSTEKVRQRLSEFQNPTNKYYDDFKSIDPEDQKGNKKTKPQILNQVATAINKIPGRQDSVGFGLVSNLPEKAPFGATLILLKKLYYKNILSVKSHNGYQIQGFRSAKVSDNFVSLLMKMMQGKFPTPRDINALGPTEKELFERLVHISGIKLKGLDRNSSVDKLKTRLSIIEGEVQAGNDSPLLKSELSTIVHSLCDFGVINKSQLKNYISQFK